MKSFAAMLLIGLTALASGAAYADAKVSVDVVQKYCTCINGKMDSNETKSISQWEKTHATEMHACEAESGWK